MTQSSLRPAALTALLLTLSALAVTPSRGCDVDNPPRLFATRMKSLTPEILAPGHSLKLIVQNGYLPGSPILVRLEVLTSRGERDWALWDADATLTVDQPGITLSTNRIHVRNGLGTVLVGVSGNTDFNLTSTVNGFSTNHL